MRIKPLHVKGEGEQGKMGLGAGDAILGTGVLGESSLLFTRQYGVISLTPSQVRCLGVFCLLVSCCPVGTYYPSPAPVVQ